MCLLLSQELTSTLQVNWQQHGFYQRVNANHTFALINAVTLTTLLCRRVTIVRCACYIIAQMAGAVAGAGMVRVAVPGALEDGLTVPHPLNTATQGQAFITEVKATIYSSWAFVVDMPSYASVSVCTLHTTHCTYYTHMFHIHIFSSLQPMVWSLELLVLLLILAVGERSGPSPSLSLWALIPMLVVSLQVDNPSAALSSFSVLSYKSAHSTTYSNDEPCQGVWTSCSDERLGRPVDLLDRSHGRRHPRWVLIWVPLHAAHILPSQGSAFYLWRQPRPRPAQETSMTIMMELKQ